MNCLKLETKGNWSPIFSCPFTCPLTSVLCRSVFIRFSEWNFIRRRTRSSCFIEKSINPTAPFACCISVWKNKTSKLMTWNMSVLCSGQTNFYNCRICIWYVHTDISTSLIHLFNQTKLAKQSTWERAYIYLRLYSEQLNAELV